MSARPGKAEAEEQQGHEGHRQSNMKSPGEHKQVNPRGRQGQ